MRKAEVKKQIIENEISQMNTNYLTDFGVQQYTAGALTTYKLKEMRLKKKGPSYTRDGQAVVYLKQDIDAYLSKKRVEHNLDILNALQNPTPEKLESIKNEMMSILFGDGLEKLTSNA